MSAKNSKLLILFYRFAYNPPHGSVSEFLHLYSLSKRDIFIWQVGANDGIIHDPVHKFIKRDKWKGVLMEPQSYVFTNYLSKLYKKSDRIITINAAMGEKDQKRPIYKISFSNDRWASGLSTFCKETLIKKIENGEIERLAKKNGADLPQTEDDYLTEEIINVLSPQTIKAKYEIDHVDVLMIDTEGYDFEIIKMVFSVDLFPEVVLFEHSHFSEKDQERCDRFLKEHAYLFVKRKANTLAVRNVKSTLGVFEKVFQR